MTSISFRASYPKGFLKKQTLNYDFLDILDGHLVVGPVVERSNKAK